MSFSAFDVWDWIGLVVVVLALTGAILLSRRRYSQNRLRFWRELLLLIVVAGMAATSISLWSGGGWLGFGPEGACWMLTGILVGALGATIGAVTFNRLLKAVNPRTRLSAVSVRVAGALAAGVLASAAGFLLGYPAFGPVFLMYSTMVYRVLGTPFGGDIIFWVLWLYTIVCTGATGVLFGLGPWQSAQRGNS